MSRYWSLWRGDVLASLPERAFRKASAEYRAPFFRSLVVSDPESVRTVLDAGSGNFRKTPDHIAALEPLLGRSLFLSEAAERDRQGAITSDILADAPARALPHVRWAGQAALARLEAGGRPAVTVETDRFARHVAADAMFRLAFSRPVSDEEVTDLLHCVEQWQKPAPRLSLGAVFPGLTGRCPGFAPEPRDAVRQLRKSVAQLVARHRLARVKGQDSGDLVGRLLEARDAGSGAPIPKVELVDQVTGLLVLGTLKTGAALAAALQYLAQHPVEQAAVAEEAARVLEGGGTDRLTLADLERTRDVVRETLRLSPPVPVLQRQATCAVSLPATRKLEEGDHVVASLWHMHRHGDHWTDPDMFRTGRWRDPASAQARRRAFLPFSIGRRACPGASLAMAEVTLLLALICRDRVLRPPPGTIPRPLLRLALGTRTPVQVTLAPRRRSDGS